MRQETVIFLRPLGHIDGVLAAPERRHSTRVEDEALGTVVGNLVFNVLAVVITSGVVGPKLIERCGVIRQREGKEQARTQPADLGGEAQPWEHLGGLTGTEGAPATFRRDSRINSALVHEHRAVLCGKGHGSHSSTRAFTAMSSAPMAIWKSSICIRWSMTAFKAWSNRAVLWVGAGG